LLSDEPAGHDAQSSLEAPYRPEEPQTFEFVC